MIGLALVFMSTPAMKPRAEIRCQERQRCGAVFKGTLLEGIAIQLVSQKNAIRTTVYSDRTESTVPSLKPAGTHPGCGGRWNINVPSRCGLD